MDDNPTTRILEERTRDIHITNIASEYNLNKRDLIAVLQSFRGHLETRGVRETREVQVIRGLPEHLEEDLDHLLGRPVVLEQDVEAGELEEVLPQWTNHQTLPNDPHLTILLHLI